jgi:cephalosporin hydroxylase
VGPEAGRPQLAAIPRQTSFDLAGAATDAFYCVETVVASLQSLARRLLSRRQRLTAGRYARIENRPWLSDLPWSYFLWKRIEQAKTNAYAKDPPPLHWKGAVLIKDPFDFAIYPMLLQELRPRTVVEIGSYEGGSAVWIADLLEVFGLDGHVYSFDIDLERIVARHPRVTYLHADASDPSTFDRALLSSLPHPWLLIEDAHINVDGVLAFFDGSLVSGDYVVVEDTFDRTYYRGLRSFLVAASGRYQVDTRYADLFGFNATWNFNGFLRKMDDVAVDESGAGAR